MKKDQTVTDTFERFGWGSSLKLWIFVATIKPITDIVPNMQYEPFSGGMIPEVKLKATKVPANAGPNINATLPPNIIRPFKVALCCDGTVLLIAIAILVNTIQLKMSEVALVTIKKMYAGVEMLP